MLLAFAAVFKPALSVYRLEHHLGFHL